jgi:hypothetical protein
MNGNNQVNAALSDPNVPLQADGNIDQMLSAASR